MSIETYAEMYKEIVEHWNLFVGHVESNCKIEGFKVVHKSPHRFEFDLFGDRGYAKFSHDFTKATIEYGLIVDPESDVRRQDQLVKALNVEKNGDTLLPSDDDDVPRQVVAHRNIGNSESAMIVNNRMLECLAKSIYDRKI